MTMLYGSRAALESLLETDEKTRIRNAHDEIAPAEGIEGCHRVAIALDGPDRAFLVRGIGVDNETVLVGFVREGDTSLVDSVFILDRLEWSSLARTDRTYRAHELVRLDGEDRIALPAARDIGERTAYLGALFHTHLNALVPDPFVLDWSDLVDEVPTCARGDYDTLLSRLDDVMIVGAQDRNRPATLDLRCAGRGANVVRCANLHDRARTIAQAVVRHFEPCGYQGVYNDGPRGQMSGYSRKPLVTRLEHHAPSALAIAAAQDRLETFLSTTFGEDDFYLRMLAAIAE